MRRERLDVRGLVCPYPTLVTSNKLSELRGDLVLEVLCDKSDSTLESITTMLRRRGYEFEVDEARDHYLVRVYNRLERGSRPSPVAPGGR